ncbi:hypothetical protein [Roseomonas sp. AR75]|uniref:hypothetical protein n=1 Tax=Roseomonas sp. AR75 TaxID=2562311 RepID=UPI0010C0FE46|nr:hypothetical protein [Roseomonas sp. AR75]
MLHVLRHCAVALAASLLAGCGLPQSPDIRAEMGANLMRLGVRPFYPVREAPRVGQILIVDYGAAQAGAGAESWQASHEWLTDDIVPRAEAARRRSAAMQTRFQQSDAQLGTQLRPNGEGVAHFRQGAALATAVPDNALMLSAFPALTLASIDAFSVGVGLPQAFTNLLAGIGLRSTRYLQVEAEGTETADLPLDDLLREVAAACRDPRSTLGNPARARQLMLYGMNAVWTNRQLRIGRATTQQERAARERVAFEPALLLLRRVHYLRGIRYVVQDSDTAAAILRGAFSAPVDPGRSTPTLGSVTVNNNPPTGANNAPVGRNADQDARLTAMAAELESLRSQVAGGTGAQVAATLMRSTARGVELVDIFDRPLAFGYEPMGWAVPFRQVAQPGGGTSVEPAAGFELICEGLV